MSAVSSANSRNKIASYIDTQSSQNTRNTANIQNSGNTRNTPKCGLSSYIPLKIIITKHMTASLEDMDFAPARSR